MMEAGVYPNLSNAEYHGGPGVSKSMLDVLAQSSPMHLHYLRTAANDNDKAPTPAQTLGTAFHALLLEPEEFARTYCLALRRQDVPEAIEDREVLVQMVQELNAKREAQHPEAVSGRDQLVAMVEELNKTRLPKLATGGSKADLVDRVLQAQIDHELSGWAPPVEECSREKLEGMKADQLKEILGKYNDARPGLLSTSGNAADLAATLRNNGVQLVLWSEILDQYQQEHGTPYIGSTSGSRHDMAEWLRANGRKVTLWSDVLAKWQENNGHRIVLSQETWDQLHAMKAAVMAHPAARALLTGKPGKAEQSVYWVDHVTGQLCRCRPDFWRADNVLVDVKTTDDASLEGFGKSISNWRYDVQDAFYCDGVKAATGNDVRAFVFLAVEKRPPYAVACYMLTPEDVELGRLQYRRDLAVYAQCQQSGQWPGYGDKIQTATLPAWHGARLASLLGAAS